MPRSKIRKNHHDYRPPANAVKAKKNKSAVLVSVIFLGLTGIGIAFFAAGSNALWLIVGAVTGAVAGYFSGGRINKAFSNK